MTDRQEVLKRLIIRSWRRGMKEVDLVLGPFAEAGLPGLDASGIRDYERMLEEADQDIFAWVSQPARTPPEFQTIIASVTQFLEDRRRQ